MPTSVVIGSSTVIGPYAVSGVEILPAVEPGASFFGPQSYLRPVWNPERSMMFKPAPVTVVIAPTMAYMQTAPESFMRPAWQPLRSDIFIAMQPQVTIPAPPGFMVAQPETFLRPTWQPPRSQHHVAPVQPVASSTPFSTISGPAGATTSVPFFVMITVANPAAQPIYLLAVLPFFPPNGNAPGDFGVVTIPGFDSLPPQVTAYYSRGRLQIPAGGSLTFSVQCVLFATGLYGIQAAAMMADGSEVLSPILSVTVRAVGA